MKKKQLSIIAHTPSSNTQLMAQALLSGAQSDNAHVQSELISPFDCDAEYVLRQGALILFTTENFSYMSGALKDFFERIFYPCLEQPKINSGKPVGIVIRAGMDGTGADTAIDKILTGLKWRKIQPTLLCKGKFNNGFLEQCETFSQTIAAGLDLGIY